MHWNMATPSGKYSFTASLAISIILPIIVVPEFQCVLATHLSQSSCVFCSVSFYSSAPTTCMSLYRIGGLQLTRDLPSNRQAKMSKKGVCGKHSTMKVCPQDSTSMPEETFQQRSLGGCANKFACVIQPLRHHWLRAYMY